jgi:hypothetical protein
VQRQCALCFLIAACLVTTSSCGSGGLGDIRGTVAVDGQPVEVGTISFRPTTDSGGKTAGAGIKDGQFQLASDHQLASGSYSVAVQASKNSGRTYKDPQRGEVPVLIQLELSDSPKEVELLSGSADNLALEFVSRKK